MGKMQESTNKDLEELKNKHAETNNTITEIKTTLEEINSRMSEAEAPFLSPTSSLMRGPLPSPAKVKVTYAMASAWNIAVYFLLPPALF